MELTILGSICQMELTISLALHKNGIGCFNTNMIIPFLYKDDNSHKILFQDQDDFSVSKRICNFAFANLMSKESINQMKKALLTLSLGLASTFGVLAQDAPTVKLNGMNADLSNGIITLKIGSNGRATTMKVSGYLVNLLASNGIYFDYTSSQNQGLNPNKAEIVRQTDDMVEVLYSNTTADLQWQQGWILRKGESGVYTYVIANGTPTSSSESVKEARICSRLQSAFLNGYVDDVMQGPIPSNSEMSDVESNHVVQDATYEMPDGSIYTKYNWAQFIDEDLFHGLMNAKYGVWNIPVSYEWLNGGPMRQELTVHATSKSPITIQMLQGEHLGGAAQAYNDGEKQIFGPVFIYVNKGDTKEEMIADARREALAQKAAWPYQWFENDLYPRERATVKGTLKVKGHSQPGSVKVVLGQPGQELIRQGKKYMFWTETDAEGNFEIKNVRPDEYSLYAYALDGDITDELEYKNVSVVPGEVNLGTVNWTPATYGNTLWAIGSNNRRADTWKISDAPRAYGLWNEVPATLTFVPGVSKESEDFYYAQCQNGTWNIEYELSEVPDKDLLLTASVAGSTNKPSVAVKSNSKSVTTWSFPNNDASIYRSATQAGRHCVKTAVIPASSLVVGRNTINLTMSGISKNGGVMYDVIKLESYSDSGVSSIVDSNDANTFEIYTLQGAYVGSFESLADLSLPKGIYVYRHGLKTGKFNVR